MNPQIHWELIKGTHPNIFGPTPKMFHIPNQSAIEPLRISKVRCERLEWHKLLPKSYFKLPKSHMMLTCLCIILNYPVQYSVFRLIWIATDSYRLSHYVGNFITFKPYDMFVSNI